MNNKNSEHQLSYASFCIKNPEDQKRVDIFLSQQLPLSRSFIQKYGKWKVNEVDVDASYILCLEDVVEFWYPLPATDILAAPEVLFRVLFEDEDILVIHKPVGIEVPTPKNIYPLTSVEDSSIIPHRKPYSIQQQLLRYLGIEKVSDRDFGLVHRLDKDTSGVLILAKNTFAQRRLRNSFKQRKVLKIYYALVLGKMDYIQQKLNFPMKRSASSYFHYKVSFDEEAKEARTDYQVMGTFEKLSLLKLRIWTGRTHQIRVHMKHIHHPVIGDPWYGDPHYQNYPLGLFAQKIGFPHPRSQEILVFSEPLPDFFEDILQEVENSSEVLSQFQQIKSSILQEREK